MFGDVKVMGRWKGILQPIQYGSHYSATSRVLLLESERNVIGIISDATPHIDIAVWSTIVFLVQALFELDRDPLYNMSASIESPPNFLSRTPYQLFSYSSSIAILFLLYISYNHILYQLAFLTPGS